MKRNSTSLADLRQMTATEAASLPTDILCALVEDVAEIKADTKAIDDKLAEAMALKFGDRAAAARRADGKDTGRVSLDEGEFIVRADLAKDVKWDNDKLISAVETVKGWGENPADYVAVKVVVSETKFNAWPSTIRKVFEPARVVGAGRPKFAIERRAA